MNRAHRLAAKAKEGGPGAGGRDTSGPRHPDESDLSLPHERDETPDDRGNQGAPGGPRQVIDQAARDIHRGLVDTEGRGVPSDVPGPGRDPEHTEGAVVPPEGVSRKQHRRPRPDGTPRD